VHKPGFPNPRAAEGLGSPQNKHRFIHNAGTNGKGSVAAMLPSIMHAAVFAPDYTPPLCFLLNERMQIDGVPISDGELAELTSLCVPLAQSMEDRPTEFELVPRRNGDFARRPVTEVLESAWATARPTNSLKIPCFVITNIGLDHTKELGPR
jgi:dihydrofolate synthase/folylpolyglutamate synthase